MHRVLLCNSAASFYVKILQTLWQFEDEGILMKSSLINDVAIRALLEAYRTKTCGPAVGAALHSMFVTSSPENKGVVVEAVLRGICLQNDDLLPLWEEAIMSGIGRSVLRLGVVEHALLNMCIQGDVIVEQNHQPLVCCIKTALAIPSFNSEKIRQAIFVKLADSPEQLLPSYISFFRALAEIDKVDTMIYINQMTGILKEKRCFNMALQAAIYDFIDHLKRRSKQNIYKEPYFQAFSEKWLF
ncbi:hypothetical protein KP509_18G012100 [Ceratopteris richardii]|uniref:Uncharacterized protein n=1 Tax=Ceratopteris richardii TaxID=49495 RepID=A0A8T2SP74_CERRI|nr:hypothetical protein KP509_18G012100 [Ceratopteris richardii]